MAERQKSGRKLRGRVADDITVRVVLVPVVVEAGPYPHSPPPLHSLQATTEPRPRKISGLQITLPFSLATEEVRYCKGTYYWLSTGGNLLINGHLDHFISFISQWGEGQTQLHTFTWWGSASGIDHEENT